MSSLLRSPPTTLHKKTGTPWYRKPLWLAIGGASLVAALLLASGQFVQAARLWPYLFLLACPLMHLLMCRTNKQGDNSDRQAVHHSDAQ